MKKKLGVILFLIIMILNTSISFVMATGESCKLMFSSSNSDVKVGETVELTLKVSDIKAESGIAAINGLLVYDEEVFEEITYEKSDDWGHLQELENVLFITTTNMESTTKDSEVLTIKLKTKSNVKPGEYVVKFTKIEAAGDNGLVFNVDDIESKIILNDLEENNQNEIVENNKDEVAENNKNEVVENNNKNDNNIGKNTNKDSNKKENSTKTVSTTNNLNNTISSKSLPKTGIKYGIMMILITIVIIFGILFYKKYKV